MEILTLVGERLLAWSTLILIDASNYVVVGLVLMICVMVHIRRYSITVVWYLIGMVIRLTC